MRRTFVMAFGLVVAGCDKDNGPTQPPPNAVTVQATSSNAFSPSIADVAIGGSVTWNFQSTGHNVTFDNISGRPENIPESSSTQVSRTFPVAGTFPYECTIHPGMTATIRAR
jgi:plastocyanin